MIVDCILDKSVRISFVPCSSGLRRGPSRVAIDITAIPIKADWMPKLVTNVQKMSNYRARKAKGSHDSRGANEDPAGRLFARDRRCECVLRGGNSTRRGSVSDHLEPDLRAH